MTNFTIHTIETAPQASKPILKEFQNKWGFIPNVLGEIATSPALLKAYKEMQDASVTLGRLSPVEVQIVQMTASDLNDCAYCLAAHTTIAEKAGIEREILTSLREGKPLKDKKLEALRQFTLSVMKKMGRPDDQDFESFIKAGYTQEHALEVILSLSLKLITNTVNHFAKTPLDKAFEANKIDKKTRSGSSTRAA